MFGWKFEKTPMGGMDYWMITTGPTEGGTAGIDGGMYKKQMDVEMPRNYIAVDKIDQAIAAFIAAGGKQIVEKMEVPGIGWSYIGVDPEGNAMGLFEAVTGDRSTRRSEPEEGSQKVEALRLGLTLCGPFFRPSSSWCREESGSRPLSCLS